MYNQFHGELQHGKYVDQTLREYFPDYTYKGIFIDVGAYEPINISNSYHFERNNWEVYCIEANTLLIPGLQEKRKHVYNCAVYDENKERVEFSVVVAGYGGGSGMAGISAVELSPQYMETFYRGSQIIKIGVEQKTLDNLLDNTIGLTTTEIDIMSIDVEGGELKVLQGLNLNKYRVKVFVIENVFNDPAIGEWLKQFNYRLDKRIDYNEYYVLM